MRAARSTACARRDGPAVTALTLEVRHDDADGVYADPSILGLAVPQSPAQVLHFVDDHRRRGRALRTIVRQAPGDLAQLLQPHAEVEPV
jgi:hypothetical protein